MISLPHLQYIIFIIIIILVWDTSAALYLYMQLIVKPQRSEWNMEMC